MFASDSCGCLSLMRGINGVSIWPSWLKLWKLSVLWESALIMRKESCRVAFARFTLRTLFFTPRPGPLFLEVALSSSGPAARPAGAEPITPGFPLFCSLSAFVWSLGNIIDSQNTVSCDLCWSLCVLFREEALPSLTQVQREDDIYVLPPLQEAEKNR